MKLDKQAWIEFRFMWKVANSCGTSIRVKSLCVKAVSLPPLPRGADFEIMAENQPQIGRFTFSELYS